MSDILHCDDCIHENYPLCLRYFLLVHRLPAEDGAIIIAKHGEPVCYATWKNPENGQSMRVRLTMASRMGDVGIDTSAFLLGHGYTHRVYINQLSDFSEQL